VRKAGGGGKTRRKERKRKEKDVPMRLIAHNLSPHLVVLLQHRVPLLPHEPLVRLPLFLRLFRHSLNVALLKVVDGCARSVPERKSSYTWSSGALRDDRDRRFHDEDIGVVDEGFETLCKAADAVFERGAGRGWFAGTIDSLSECFQLAFCLC
jgi:hypothetical protein